ncbi:MAG: DUF3619 family protein [Burkholderiaceae bacterium]|jgi:hypothetical protein|nr:DUF3619 family protein [Burkholderiaceae bacterium]
MNTNINTNYDSHQTGSQQARYGLRVAARLSAGLDSLPYSISERLRAARQQAVAQRKQPQTVMRLRTASAVLRNGDTATLGWGSDGMSPWGWLLSAALALSLVAGLVVINIVQDDSRTMELADLDTALLTDDLPPEAYADPGFLQYLKSKADASVTTR